MSFKNLKRDSNKFDKLVDEAAKLTNKKSYSDDRMWKPTVDKVGNGFAEIRFLPAPEGEELPWVQYFDHFFKGPTGLYYVERSLTTLGEPDPLGEYNSVLWNQSEEKDSPGRKQARNQKRKLNYVSNIEVIKDPDHPENEGKQFLYQYGKKIFDKIMDKMQPEFDDEEAINPFDFWAGANFKLKIRQVDGFRNYDKCEFGAVAVHNEDDAELEKIYDNLYSLTEFNDPKHYKSYGELKTKMNSVLGLRAVSAENEVESTPPPAVKEVAQSPVEEDDDDDIMASFSRLANED